MDAALVDAAAARLACPACQRLLAAPVTTPCLHTLCRGCVADACPVCGAATLPAAAVPAIEVERVIDALQQVRTAVEHASSDPKDASVAPLPPPPATLDTAASQALPASSFRTANETLSPPSPLPPEALDLDTQASVAALDAAPTLLLASSNPEHDVLVHDALDVLGGTRVSLATQVFSHLVVTANDQGLTQRSAKYLHALIQGAWVVSIAWVQDSVRQGSWLPEASYEVLGDESVDPAWTVPARARQAAKQGASLFDRVRFHLLEPFPRPMYDELRLLLVRAGADMVSQLAVSDTTTDRALYVLCDPTWQPERVRQARQELAHQASSAIVTSSVWALACIGEYSLLDPSEFDVEEGDDDVSSRGHGE